MESYNELMAMRPEVRDATILVDGVKAKIDYELAYVGILYADYIEDYTNAELDWLLDGESVELRGRRRYSLDGKTESVISTITLEWGVCKGHSVRYVYAGESRRNALQQFRAIVEAIRAAIDTVSNADNPDFEAELGAAVSESVTGGEDGNG